MAKKTLYAYANGNKHADAVVTAVETAFDALVAKRKWVSKDVWVVNQQEDPHWDLGINLIVPSGKALSVTFLEDIEAIANELGALQAKTKSTFVMGVHDSGSDEIKDLFTVDSAKPNLEAIQSSFRDALKIK